VTNPLAIQGLIFHQDTRRDILVSRTGDQEQAVWLRNSEIDFEPITGGLVDVICPAGLAAERGLA
jgi:hypothetical protein